MTFANIVFERCYFREEKGKLAIVDVEKCTPGQSSRNIRLHHVSFIENKLIGAVGLQIRSPICSSVEMIDVTLIDNACFGRGCGAMLASDNRLVNCTVSENRLEASHKENPSILYAPSGSRMEVSRLNASKNELTVFRAEGGSLSLTDSTFVRNKVDRDRDEDPFSPCIHLVDSSAVIVDSAFRNNSGTSGSAVFAARSDVSVSSTSFEHNFADNDGGALFLEDGSAATLDRCAFAKNIAKGNGGSFYLVNSNATMEDAVFEKDRAGIGGSLYLETSSVEVATSNISAGSATKGGGIAVEYSSRLILKDTRVRKCQAQEGGAVFMKSRSISRIKDSVFESNSADKEGGVLSIFDSEVIVQRSRAFNNTGTDVGGFIAGRDSSSIRVSDSSLNLNSAENGGALYSGYGGSIVFIDCQLSENTVKRTGGSIYAINGTVDILRTQFEDGVAESGGYVNVLQTTVNISNSSFKRGKAHVTGGCLLASTESDVLIQDTQFRSSEAGNSGAALYILGSRLIVRDSKFIDNAADAVGGAIECMDICQVNISGSTFKENRAGSGGALDIYQESTASLFQCDFTQNSAERRGGGSVQMTSGSKIRVEECRFSEETSQTAGGSLFSIRGAATIVTSSFAEGHSGKGGCMYFEKSTVEIRDTKMANSTASNGGALFFEDSITNITNCSLVRNTADADGGAVYLTSYMAATELTITEVNVTKNTAGLFGGGIAADEATALRIFNSSFSKNSAKEGGAIHQKATIDGLYTNIRFRNNRATKSGGAVYVSEHSAAFDRCDMEGNNATDGGSILANDATVNITHSTFRRSEAHQHGGAIMVTGNSSVAVTDTTVEDSRASKKGGGIYSSSAKIEAQNLTILRCQSEGEGGGFAGLKDSAFLCNDCVFEENSASKEGGGVSIRSSKQRLVGVQLEGCRLRNNVAHRGGE